MYFISGNDPLSSTMVITLLSTSRYICTCNVERSKRAAGINKDGLNGLTVSPAFTAPSSAIELYLDVGILDQLHNLIEPINEGQNRASKSPGC